METLIVIPARFASSRLPGKPLRKIAGQPMIWHVYQRARECRAASRVVVATDHDEIRKTVLAFGGECLLTRPDHPTGSDRVAEVAQKIPADIYLNLQGDEPVMDPQMLQEVLEPFADPNTPVSTLKSRFSPADKVENPNLVKVVVDREDWALFFSRSPIPHCRRPDSDPVFYLHHGIYAYRREPLLAFGKSSPTPLERAESLEQLRFLELGFRIKVPTTSHRSIGVDTEEDLARVEGIISKTLKI
ncbi:MAG: 3-deoxy-manno-octulosonate cytidylyltransferase [Proteobacteria bacterium]|nr:3-deoxy-manno-octulosonate cytidylyltransferase [Pseudomonadota bacterium]